MPVEVMKCVEKFPHPNADTLTVYRFAGVTGPTLQVIANQEHTYEVDDNAIIAREYTDLKDADNTKIRPCRLRGVISNGMAMGKTDLAVGTDLTGEYAHKEETVDGLPFRAWPDIGQMFNVRKNLESAEVLRKVPYRKKVKLHGTNAAVRLGTDGAFATQSRERLLSLDNDNYGFCRWAEENNDLFETPSEDAITVFGEWCGQGIGGCAIRQIDRKIFAVFAVMVEDPGGFFMVTDPITIHTCYVSENPERGLYILPWCGQPFELDYANKEELRMQAAYLDKLVKQIEDCDPFVKDAFGIEGMGEGFVAYPTDTNTRFEFSELTFKAKGEKHKVVKTKQAVQVDPEVAKSIDEFVDLFATEARFEQMAEKVGGDYHQKFTGAFVKEFSQDVKKESTAELAAANLEWKQVAKAVNKAASNWWQAKCREI